MKTNYRIATLTFSVSATLLIYYIEKHFFDSKLTSKQNLKLNPLHDKIYRSTNHGSTHNGRTKKAKKTHNYLL